MPRPGSIPGAAHLHGGTMIQLRYVSYLTGEDATAWRLQYRVWQVRLDSAMAITPAPLPVEWTPWEDVPYVREKP